MTLRRKTLLIIGLALGGLFLALYFALSNVLLDGFARVENQITRQNVQRVLEAYRDEVAKFETKSGDWAPWDATYRFIADQNPDYVAANLTESTFSNLGLNVMLFVDTDGEIVHGEGFDLQTGAKVPVADSIPAYLAGNDLLLQHTATDSLSSGLILLPENPMLVAARPIVTSGFEGPIRGTLIMGRYLDSEEIQLLADRTRFSLTFRRLDDPQTTSAFQAVLSSLAEPDSILVQPLSQERIAGYTVLRDVDGQPALLLQVDMPRDVFAQGQISLQALIIALLLVGAVFVILTLLLLERLVLARVARLHEGVGEIGASGDLARRLSLPGSDELTSLALAINQMLQDLQDSLAREKELRQQVQQLRIEIDQVKKERQVSEITETDYFRSLQAKAQQLRSRSSKTPHPSKKE